MVSASNVNIFRNKLDQFWKNQEIKLKCRKPLTMGRTCD